MQEQENKNILSESDILNILDSVISMRESIIDTPSGMNKIVHKALVDGFNDIFDLLRPLDCCRGKIEDYDTINRIRVKDFENASKGLPFRIPYLYYREEVEIQEIEGKTWVDYFVYDDYSYDWSCMTEYPDSGISPEKWENIVFNSNFMKNHLLPWHKKEVEIDEIIERSIIWMENNKHFFKDIIRKFM